MYKGEPPLKKEFSPLPENDQVLNLIRTVEAGYPGYHLVVGSVGVMGSVSEEYRVVHDLDLCVPRAASADIDSFFGSLGFQPLPEDQLEHLHKNGMMYQKDGLGVDVWYGDFTDTSLELLNPSGKLIVPLSGLNFDAHLRDITFQTFTPELHYFIKERATRRNPFNTINPLLNRPQDIADLKVLTQKIDITKAKSLLADGLKYEGHHPMVGMIKDRISKFINR